MLAQVLKEGQEENNLSENVRVPVGWVCKFVNHCYIIYNSSYNYGHITHFIKTEFKMYQIPLSEYEHSNEPGEISLL